jgi:hydroxypyruvate reductase
MRSLLLDMFASARSAVAADAVMPRALPAGRLTAVAVGKGAAEMMAAAQARAAAPLPGLVVVPYGQGGVSWPGVEVIEASHPVPDANSVRAGTRALEIARGLREEDRLLLLLSGGGSALMALPAPGVTLEEKQALTRALLRSGAPIGEMNAVRARLSAIKGGKLAEAAFPAAVTNWIVSDVPGNDPARVASGPGIVAGAEVKVLASGADALAAAAGLAGNAGYRVIDLGDGIEGEAEALALDHASLVNAAPVAILSGGEASVTVRGQGRGGRNLHYLLALAIALDGRPGVSAIACDTDGIDGSSDAAGALLFRDSLARAAALGLDARDHLARCDAHAFFAALGDLVVTGPTGVNVNDFRAILVDQA